MQLRRVLVVLAVAAASVLGAQFLLHGPVVQGVFEPLELQSLEWRIRSATRLQADTTAAVNPRADSSEIRIILLDSLAVASWPYQEPFPRGHLADLVGYVSARGARAIGLDVYLDRLYPVLDSMDAGDRRLREAIHRAGNVVLAAPTEGTADRRVLQPPHPYFADVAAAVATADVDDRYETLYDWVFAVRTERGLIPGFPLAIYAVAEGMDLPSLMGDAESTGRLPLPDVPAGYGELEEDEAVHTMPLLYAGPPSGPDRSDGAFKAVSSDAMATAGEYFDFAVGEDFFRDKLVLIGSGYHYEDRFRTPYYDEELPGAARSSHDGEEADRYGWMYGVEVHANALENLLTRSYILPFGTARTLLLLGGVTLLIAAMTFWRGVGLGATALIVVLVGTVGGAWLAFDASYLHVPLVAPTLAGVFAFLGSTSYVSIVEGRDKRLLRGAFSKYVPAAVVDELVADPSKIKLGGEKRTISILFSDLAGFTSLSESMDPQRLVSLLNEYLDDMADIVFDEGGTLDKYIGDAIMTLYGAPAAQQDHALRACRTALRMHRRLEQLNAEWRARGVDVRDLHMRIGINTGTPVVGNIGGEKRFDYTALGDAVNLAARLEPACKSYGVATMISAAAREAAGDRLIVRELELLAVYGKTEPVPVYELIGLAGEDLGDKAEVLEHYGRGLAAYRNRDFELAREYFRAATEVDPNDGPSALYMERAQEYIVNPPPVDWDFVERRQVK